MKDYYKRSSASTSLSLPLCVRVCVCVYISLFLATLRAKLLIPDCTVLTYSLVYVFRRINLTHNTSRISSERVRHILAFYQQWNVFTSVSESVLCVLNSKLIKTKLIKIKMAFCR